MIDPILSKHEVANIREWYSKHRNHNKVDGMLDYYMALLIAEVERYQEKYDKK